jgi:cytidyltransferase-like protein
MDFVIISGYFNPIHKGHIDYIKAAKGLGDVLIAIVNNDVQQEIKKGKIILPEADRMEIIKSLKYVDECVLAIDQDNTVIKTLEMLAKKIRVREGSRIRFANGGDRHSEKLVPESVLSEKYGIEFVYGVGGTNKIDSSTRINALVKEPFVVTKPEYHDKIWGSEEWIVNSELYCGKILNVNKGHNCSYHFHKIKDETFCILSGTVVMNIEGETYIMGTGDIVHLAPYTKHTFKALENARILEISTQHFEEDSYRLIRGG